MDKVLLPGAARRGKSRKRRQLWKRIVGTLGVAVVFCTVYALVLPAITLSDDPVCGMEAHEHTDQCLLTELRRAECPLAAQPCGEEGPVVLHAHSEICYDHQGTLLCQLPERQAHLHTEDCYETVNTLVCRLEELDAHTHEPSCFSLVCTGEDHDHGEGCYAEPVICEKIESGGHAHSDACYAPAAQLTCTLEQVDVHTHDESCCDADGGLVCGILPGVVHDHDETCFSVVRLEEPEYLCLLSAHVHSEECYQKANAQTPTQVQYLCGYSRHLHVDTCFGTDGTLECTIPEHRHEPECLGIATDPEADVETAEQWEATLAAVELTGNWGDDLAAIAESQLGYRESEKNLILNENGDLKGYSRYGARYGTPYIDWGAAFVSFCVHYAGIDALPQDTACDSYIATLQGAGLYRERGSCLPQRGDLIFLTEHGCGIVTQMIYDEDAGTMRVEFIQGDTSGGVSVQSVCHDDESILGYGQTPPGDDRVLNCTEDHDHTGGCYAYLVYYQDDTMFVRGTVTGVDTLPEDVTLQIDRVTAVSNPEAYRGMTDALGQTLKDAPYDVGDTDFFDMTLLQGQETYLLPEGAKIRVEITFSQPVFSPGAVEDSLGVGTFLLTPQTPIQARSVSAFALRSEDSTYLASAVGDETYTGKEEGITGLTFETENLTSFAVMLADTESDATYWTRVTDLSQLNGGTYLIISAEGNYALRGDNSSNYTAVQVEGVKGNTQWFTVKDGTDYIDKNHYWTITASGSGYTIQNQGTSNYLYMGTVRNGWFYQSYVIHQNSKTLYLKYYTPENCWRIRTVSDNEDGTSLKNPGTGAFTYSSGNNGTGSWGETRYYQSDMLILKLDETAAPVVPEDFTEEQTGNAGAATAPEKPNYGDFITPSDSKTGPTELTDPQGGEAVQGEYFSDTATSNLESQFRKDTVEENRINDGKVLSDKSVIYGMDDYGAFSSYAPNTFSVTLSALGQDYETPYQDTVRVPIDVMFVLDVSGSMTVADTSQGKDANRAIAMTKATNAAIRQIMDDHPANRVGVVVYSGGAWKMLPLDRYTADNDEYLVCEETAVTHGPTGYSSKIHYVTGGSTVKNKAGVSYAGAGSDAVQGWGTYTQAGIAMGYEYFKEVAGSTTYTTEVGTGDYVREYTVNRQPVYILLSDGEPTYSTNLYNDVLNGPHYGDGDGGTVNAKGIHGYNTILSANYYKRMVGIQYQCEPLFYTVGMKINEVLDEPLLSGSSNGDNYKRAVLNPTVENITNLTGGKNGENTADQLRQLMLGEYTDHAISTRSNWPEVWSGISHIYTPVLAKNPYADDYSYADGAFFGDINSEGLTDIFSNIILSSLRVKPYGFILYQNSSVDMFDNIGAGMEVQGTPVLRYGGVNHTDPEITVEGNVTTFTYKGTYADPYIPNRKVDLSIIRVTLTEYADGTQTVEMYIPDACLPTYTPELIGNKYYYESLPVRLIYQVGLTEESQQQVLKLRETGGELVFYTNRWEIEGQQAYTTLLPSTANPFYNDVDPEDDVYPAYHAHRDAKEDNATDTLPYRVNSHLETYDGEHGETIQVTHELGNNGKLVFRADPPKDPDIPVEKVWDETVPEESRQEITLTLWRYEEATQTSTQVQTLTLSTETGWTGVFTEVALPEQGYRYYILEDTDVFHATYDNPGTLTVDGTPITVGLVTYDEDGQPLGVTVTNTKQYLLPETGGSGTLMYILAGLVLMLGTALISPYFVLQRRKEGRNG